MTTLRRLLESFWLAPLVAGVLWWASFPPLDLGYVAPFGWAVLLASMRLRRGRAAARQGLLAGLVLFVPGIAWIEPLVSAGWLFTATWSACFEALFAWLLARLFLRRERAGWVVAAGLLHLFVDGLRTYALSGFPWLLPGYAGWHDVVLREGAGLLGVHGATLAIVWLGAGGAEALARRMEDRAGVWRPLVPAAVWWAALGAYVLVAPAPVERPGPTVALLQANVPQRLKEQILDEEGSGTDLEQWWREHLAAWWRAHEKLLQEIRDGDRDVDVVIWPETMVPPWPERPQRDARRSARLWMRLAHLSGDAQTLAGVLLSDDLGRQWNSVLLIDADGNVLGGQDKQHLAPGGEYIPFLESVPFRAEIEAALRDKAGFLPSLQRGAGPHLLALRYPGGEARAGVLICYESIFPELARAMVRDGADLLVNASNYGWFEGTAEMDQALAMACFRAAELGVPVVLASNNGHSTVIAADGVPGPAVVDAAGRRTDVAGYVIAQVPLGGRWTPFRLWGENAAWLLGLSGVLWGVLGGLRRPSP